ncbi:MAG: thioredoxin family protein [Pseudomonadota bacterium]
MKKIQILGTGCPKCKKLFEETEKVANELGGHFEFEKITDIEKIIACGVMATPALVVDGEVKACGRIPSKEDLIKMLS